MNVEKKLTAVEVVRMLLDACKELLAESGRQRAGDWEIINDGMIAGERFIHQYADSLRRENES